jgi:LysR family nitrogen assimilation transcriptional regulator
VTINLKQLRYFVKVAETGNITRASEKLHVAQTALGLQIRHLEESLGVELLIRHSRGISLSEAGRALYRHAVAILQSVEEARRDVSALGSAKKEIVNLGVTPSIQALIGPELLLLAQEELPQMSLRMVEELSFILVDALLRGDLDLALAYELDDRPGLVTVPLVEEELLFIAGAGTDLPEGPIRFHDIVQTDLALVSERDIVWRLMHEAAAKLSLNINVAFEVQSMPAIKTLVARGVATSVVPYGVVAEDIEQGLIVARSIVEPSIRRRLFLSRRAERMPFVHERKLVLFLEKMVRRLAAKMQPYGSLIGEGLTDI